MFEGLYIAWALLPLVLAFISLKAAMRIALKRPGREYPLRYLKQSIFCAVALGIAIVLDRAFFDTVADTVAPGVTNIGILRFLIYPGVLLILGKIQATFEPSDKPKVGADLEKRMRFADR